MADTYDPQRFIPLREAYLQAFDAIESWTPSVAGNDAELHGQLDKRDAAERRVERLMRDALADGLLHPFLRAANGQIERLIYREEVDRERWRQKSFGVPGLENVPHHLTNPGPNTDGLPVLLQIGDFEEWLGCARPSNTKPGGKLPLAESKIDQFVRKYIEENPSHSQDGLIKFADASPFKIPREKLRSAYKRLIGKSLKRGRPTKVQALQK